MEKFSPIVDHGIYESESHMRTYIKELESDKARLESELKKLKRELTQISKNNNNNVATFKKKAVL